MPIRQPFASERIQLTDPLTGIKVIQITSYPTPSVHLMYDWPSITPDNERVVFLSQRWTQRSAPWDLYRCDTDGLGLFQLTERDEKAGHPSVVMSLDGKTVYAVWREEYLLCTVDVETGATTELMDLRPYCPEEHVLSGIRIGGMGRRLFVSFLSYTKGGGRSLGIDLESGKLTQYEGDMGIMACDQSSNRLIVVRNYQKLGTKKAANGSRVLMNANPEPMTLWSIDEERGDEQYIATVDMFGHSTMLGRTNKIQGTGQPPHRCIWIAEAGKEPYKLVEGPYFWHSGASFDGEWILSDTNWPDEGLQLIHVPTRHFRTLCHAHARQEHSQFGHPHPALSQDGRVAVFNSDRTGVAQVYLAHITEEFREGVKAGVLDNPKDKWI